MMKILNNRYFQAFCLSFFLGCLIILPSIIAGHGALTLMDDLNMQQIPFNEVINESLKSGNIYWTWLNDLGTNFIGSFSFYNLASPFVLLGLLFPADAFPYVIGPIFILKYAVAGLTSYLFLQQYVKDKRWALIGSLLYSFSGFQITNMLFYHFHDVVAFFPLLLYALDRLVKDNKKFLFCLVVTLSVFTNYFFFIEEVVFLVIYYLVRVFTKSYVFSFKSFSRIIFEGCLGVGIAMVILLPSLVFVLDNPRIENTWDLKTMLFYDVKQYAEIVRALIFPNEVMSFRSVLSEYNFSSVETYLPLVGCVFAFSYLGKKPKDWVSVLFVICLIFMFIPILNSSFLAFTCTYYARWYFMLIMVMSLLTVKCLDEGISVKFGVFVSLLFLVVFGILLCYIYFVKGEIVLYNKIYFILYSCALVICLIYVCLTSKSKHQYLLLIIGIFVYVCLRGNYFFYQNKGTFGMTDQMNNYLFASKNIDIQENDIRMDSSRSCLRNLSYLTKIPNLKSFNSNLQGTNFEFYNSVGVGRTVSTVFEDDEVELRNFLSVKYLISCDGTNKEFDKKYKLIKKDSKFSIYENPNYKKMGISYNYYISQEDFLYLGFDERRRVLNKAIILDEYEIKKYGNLLKKYKKSQNDYINELSKNEFAFIDGGFTDSVSSDKDALILYTVPFDSGWTARVNGKDVDVEKVDYGLIAIKIDEGDNDIVFSYRPPKLRMGFLISVISIIIFLTDLLIAKRGKLKFLLKKK